MWKNRRTTLEWPLVGLIRHIVILFCLLGRVQKGGTVRGCVCARARASLPFCPQRCVFTCALMCWGVCGEGRWTNPRVRLSGLTETICSAAKCGDRTHARTRTHTLWNGGKADRVKQKACVAWGKRAANTVQPLITPDWGWDCDLLSFGHDWLNHPSIHPSIHSCHSPSLCSWPLQWRWRSCWFDSFGMYMRLKKLFVCWQLKNKPLQYWLCYCISQTWSCTSFTAASYQLCVWGGNLLNKSYWFHAHAKRISVSC